jgi:hypothetical protein
MPLPVDRAHRLNPFRECALYLSKGVEHWQVNFSIDPEGLTLLRYFPLKLFTA